VGGRFTTCCCFFSFSARCVVALAALAVLSMLYFPQPFPTLGTFEFQKTKTAGSTEKKTSHGPFLSSLLWTDSIPSVYDKCKMALASSSGHFSSWFFFFFFFVFLVLYPWVQIASIPTWLAGLLTYDIF
jgi:hypothetical protein